MNTAFVVDGEPPGSPGLEIDSPFDPDAGQSAAIRYTLGTDAALVRVRIFDGAGRLVRQLEDGNLSGPAGTPAPARSGSSNSTVARSIG